MALFLVLALQAAAPTLPAVDFDLARLRHSNRDANSSRGPSRSEGAEIIVIGRRPPPNAYRLPELPEIWGERPVRAERSLGGGAVAGIYVDSVEFPGGQISQRILFGIKVPF